MINTTEELEEQLSRPTPADVAAMTKLSGDILILGAAGKMGPSLAKLAKRSILQAGVNKRVIAVARFSDPQVRCDLERSGIETTTCDLLEPGAIAQLPDVENVVFMAARKFGTSGSEYLTWAMNTFLPGLVAERYRSSRIVAFSTGNVYGLQPVSAGGATESTPLAPAGEYAQSALGRERMFEYGSSLWKTKTVLLRLNYAVELRYGGGHCPRGFPSSAGQPPNGLRQRHLAARRKFRVPTLFGAQPISAAGAEYYRSRSALSSKHCERIWQVFRDRTSIHGPAGRCRDPQQCRQGNRVVRTSDGCARSAYRLDRELDFQTPATSQQTNALRSPGWKVLMNVRDELRKGLVIPAHPLALTETRKLDERHQRALTRY